MIYFIDLIHVMVIEVKALSNVRSGWFPVLTLPENRHNDIHLLKTGCAKEFNI